MLLHLLHNPENQEGLNYHTLFALPVIVTVFLKKEFFHQYGLDFAINQQIPLLYHFLKNLYLTESLHDDFLRNWLLYFALCLFLHLNHFVA